MGGMGKPINLTHQAFLGYYDGHKDTYFSTDSSNQAQATSLHINFSSALNIAAALTPLKGAPAIYLVQGRAAPNQLAVFGSEPGDHNYTPLWRETDVSWAARAKPVLLVSDNQILALAKKGQLTLTITPIVLNCPIVKKGK
jgi:hypothetical protein